MKKQRKLIGVIAGQIEICNQAGIMKGICDIAFSHDYDIVVFSIFIKEYARPLYQIGEVNIYNIINYELLDGIILIPDTLRIPGLLSKIRKEIKTKFTGPVISLDYELEDCINLEYDDTTSMEKMTDHLIDVHHLTNIAMLTGPKDHPHSKRRLKGYLNSLEKHNIPVNENQIYYGTFWYTDGESVVNHMLTSLPKLPQAIVCACDAMAVGVCDALRKHHLRVPQDIAVTGYDAQESGLLSKPTLTSMEHNTHSFGRYAMTRLIEAIEQTPPSKPMDTTSCFLQYESCGCPFSTENIDYSKLNRGDTDFFDEFYNAYNYMMEELISADNINELLERIGYYTYQLDNFDQYYLSLCDNWDYVGCSYEASQNYNSTNYTSKMHLKIAKGAELHILENEVYPSSIMLPIIWKERKKPAAFFFSPIHFRDRCFGYSVISYTNSHSLDLCYRDWIRTVGIAFENLRVKNNFKWSNQQLEQYAQIDSLTKIFNRNGYMKYSSSFYEIALKENKELFVLMGDLDNLKKINDKYGHVEGDNAIQLCAVAFRRACGQHEKCFRYGGDEFILLGVGNYTKADELLYEKEIESYLRAYNEVSDKPYQVNLSLGYWHGMVDEQHDLDDYVKLADKAMFKKKQYNKSKRYLSSKSR